MPATPVSQVIQISLINSTIPINQENSLVLMVQIYLIALMIPIILMIPLESEPKTHGIFIRRSISMVPVVLACMRRR